MLKVEQLHGKSTLKLLMTNGKLRTCIYYYYIRP